MTSQDYKTESETRTNQLTFSSFNKDMKDLQQQVVFSFSGTQFNISQVDQAVCYLKITIDNVEHLSLFHLFLWQHRQGLLLNSNIQLIIIQDTLQESIIKISEYWHNLVSLSIQMGFSVLSYQVKMKEEIKIEEQTMDSEHEVIIFSENSSIDSQLFPNYSLVNNESSQKEQDTDNKKSEPYTLTCSNFKLPSTLSNIEKQTIMQRIGMTVHKLPVYAHILPMIFGYSAYLIYKQMLESQLYVGQSFFVNSQQTYNNAVNETLSLNFFELPVHLLEVFEFTDENKFIFQQMCDVSYMFKAQYFAIFSAFFPLDNAVISQSSRSGKTVTLHTIFYFNLFSGLKIPILINIGYQQSSFQPLYNRSSIQLGDNLEKIFAFPKKATIENITAKNLKQVLIRQNYLSYLVSKINLYIQCFQEKTQSKSIISAFDEYLSGQTEFNQFLSISLVDFSKVQNDNYCEADNNLDQQLDLTNKSYGKNFSKKDQERLKGLQVSHQMITQKQEYNQHKEILMLVDESLSHQRNNYKETAWQLVQFAEFYTDKFIGQARSCVENVLQILESSMGNFCISEIQRWLDDDTSVDMNSDKSKQDMKKKLSGQISSILQSDQVEEYFFKLLCYYDLFRDTIVTSLVDFITISSPNFCHVETSTTMLEYFSEFMKDLKQFPNRTTFKQKLYHFMLMLYNPRGMETIFWRNICYLMNQTTQSNSLLYGSQINYKISEYFANTSRTKHELAQKLEIIFNKEFSLKEQFQLSFYYQGIRVIQHGKFNFLSAGTDISIVNFNRWDQHKHIYYCSRGTVLHMQSNIHGISQMHPSCLTQNYYRDKQITTQSRSSMIQQIAQSVQNMNIKDLYLIMIPEFTAELQFLCPLICPQIIINQQNEFRQNSTSLFLYSVNQRKIYLNQISSHTQILNSLKIMRSNYEIGARQLLGDVVLIKQQSVSKFSQNLHLTSSSSLNRDMVFALNFLACQKFQETITYVNEISDKASISDICTTDQIKSLFTQQQISEISSTILLFATLSRQHPTHIIRINKLLKQINKYSQYLEIYVNPLQTGQNQQITLAEIYVQFQSLFEGAFPMFLQKSFFKYCNQTQPKIQMYVSDAVQNASVCFIKLKQLGMLKEKQKLAIVTIMDKTSVSSLFFKKPPLMPDYLISLFGVSDQELKVFSGKEMLSIQAHEAEGQTVQSINLLMDSGTHSGQEIFRKQQETGITTCLSVTKEYKQNSMQICLYQQVSLYYGQISGKKAISALYTNAEYLSKQIVIKDNDVIKLQQHAEYLSQNVVRKSFPLIFAKQNTDLLSSIIERKQSTLFQQKYKIKQLISDLKETESLLECQKIEYISAQALLNKFKAQADKNTDQEENEKMVAKLQHQLENNNLQEQLKTVECLSKIVEKTEQQIIEQKQGIEVQKQFFSHAESDISSDKERLKIAENKENLAKTNSIQAENATNLAHIQVEKTEKEVESLQNAYKKAQEKVVKYEQLVELAEKQIGSAVALQQLASAVKEVENDREQQVSSSLRQEHALKFSLQANSQIEDQQLDLKESSTVNNTLNCLQEDIIQEKASLAVIQLEISEKSSEDQEFINSYIDRWNQLMSQENQDKQLFEGGEKEQEVLSLINQQHNQDIDEFCELLQKLTQIQQSKSLISQSVELLSKYLVLSIPLVLEFENQFLQEQDIEVQIQDVNQSEDELMQLVQKWLSKIYKESQENESKVGDLIKQLPSLLHLQEKLCVLVFKVLLEKLNQIVMQEKQQQKQKYIFNYKEYFEEGQKLKEKQDIFKKKFYLLDIFYFTNYKREFISSDIITNYLRHMENQTLRRINNKLDQLNQNQQTEKPIE